MQSTQISAVLDIMNQWKDIDNVEEQYKIRALDTSIRKFRQKTLFPWNLKKSTLKIFDGVLEYPVASDHDELAYLDNQSTEEVSSKVYGRRARFFYTSIQQFYEDTNSARNNMAEIWDNGTKYLGVRYKDLTAKSQQLSSAETSSEYTASGDASGVVADIVNYKRGNGSIRFTITNSTNSATIKNTFNAISDSNYKRKYHFRWIYLDVVPTSIEMRLQTDDSNYLSSGAITTQFSGQAFKADDWNLIAYDLNTATETGTFNSASIASEKVILTNGATGTYYLDQSDLREWELFDYYYYSKNNIATSSTALPTQEYMYNNEVYDITYYIVGDSEWIDVLINDALEALVASVENAKLFGYIMRRKEEVWNAFNAKYPDMTPIITTQRNRFNNDPIYANETSGI